MNITKHPKQNNATSQNPTASPNATAARTKRVSTVNLRQRIRRVPKKLAALIRDPKYKETWSQSAANEFGRLTQGVGGRFRGTNTNFFIHKNQVPHKRMKDVTHGSFSCDYKPNKAETETM